MEWRETQIEFPKPEVAVIAFGLNRYNKGRRIRAFYAPRWTVEGSIEDECEASEYNEEDDNYYLREGWYETNEHEDVHWMVDFPVTHWMPLPAPPNSIT